MTSLAQTSSGIGPDAITPPVSAAIEKEKKTEKLDEGQPDIEYAEKGGEVDLPAVVDIHGDVIKADWHAIRAKANEAEAYEHSLGLWQAMRAYKKVCSFVFALRSSSLGEAERKFSDNGHRPSSGHLSPPCPSSWKVLTTQLLEAATLPSPSSAR